MDKINFENRPSTNTPINAKNLNRMQDNAENGIEEATAVSYVTAFLGTKQHISKTTNRKILLDTAYVKGDYFEFDKDNNQIKVLKNCTASISAHCFVENSDGDNYIFLHILKNSSNIAGHLQEIINRMYTNCSIPAVAIDLVAGDIITMTIDYESGSGDPYIRNNRENTWLSVVKL